ncbi:MAG: hypothetical protein ABSA68_19495 [Xanthobacteraceae bacterium]
MKFAILVFWLIGVVADPANIEIGWFRYFWLVKEAKVSVSNNIEARIQKTSLHDEGVLPVYKFLINGFGGNFCIVIVAAKSCTWENDLPGNNRWRSNLAILEELKDTRGGSDTYRRQASGLKLDTTVALNFF